MTQASNTIAVTFDRAIVAKPCGFEGSHHRYFRPLPVVETSEPITQTVRMRTLSKGVRVMVGVRTTDGKRVKQ